MKFKQTPQLEIFKDKGSMPFKTINSDHPQDLNTGITNYFLSSFSGYYNKLWREVQLND